MDVQAQIQDYIAGQAQRKRDDLQTLHRMALGVSPNCRLWFLDGRNDQGQIVSNPNIGYGVQAKRYANGDVKEFYQVGFSANTAGISIYIMGLSDKTHLSRAYRRTLGKAKITGYCVTFKSLDDVNLDVIKQMVADHLAAGAAFQS
jgi:hypothetical protein